MAKLVISGVIDGPLTGGLPKAVELTVLEDIADLSIYGIGSANNGGGSDGEEFTFPAVSATAGDKIYIAIEEPEFIAFFGFDPDFIDGAASINGDDAIELFENSTVIDIFGTTDHSELSTWNHVDGWAYRVSGTGPDGSTFNVANWTFSGIDALDGETTNGTAETPFPTGTYAAPTSGPTDLFISEYVEGTSLNKAIEIFNGTGAAIDLTPYTLEFYFNGSTSPGATIDLTGTVADGDVFVVADDGADAAILAVADQTSPANFFNGDDAVVLRKDGVVIDAFGQVGTDPGSEWPGGGENDTLRRKSSIIEGDADETDAFDASVEWESFPQNTFDGLGSHSIDGGPAPATTISVADVTAGEADGTMTFTVTRSGDTTGASTVDFATSDGTATAGSDYVATSGTLSFAAGETTKQVDVALIDDADVESDETVTLTLSNPTGGATLGTATATGTISNDDISTTPTLISAIQGDGTASPLVGQVVTIEAIVTGDFQDGAAGTNGDLNGFFLMEEDADQDGNAMTSEGIFVFDGSGPDVDVQIGDRVTVTGTVAEFFGETQISATSVSVVSSDNALPTAATIVFPVANAITNSDGNLIADLEAYEGMLVTVPQELTVSDLFTLNRFGDIGLHADGRLEQFTQANTPDVAGFQAFQDLAVRNTIILDDGVTTQNPATIPFEIPTEGGNIPGQFDAGDDLNVGDTVEGLTGVLRFSRGSGGSGDEIHRLLPTDVLPFENTNPRETEAPEVGGRLKVSTFNVLNFFTTLDVSGNPGSGPDGADPRGAESTTEFERQLDKLLAAFGGLNADIYGLVEIENEIGDQNGDGAFAIASLTAAINAKFGTNYGFVDPGVSFVGGDAIMGGFIYNADTVKVAEGTTVAILDDSVLPSLGLDFGNPVFNGPGTSRVPIAVTFEEISSGEKFTATTNHFKSKGSVSPFGDNAGTGDGSGNNDEARTQAAIALDAWLDTDPTGSGDADFLILGDLNAYKMETPIQTLLDEGYIDVIEANLGPDEISYSFGFPLDLDTSAQVQAFGSLDYGLANASLASQVTGASKWHINADEASGLDYNTNFKPAEQITDLFGIEPTPFRSSDHDPLVIGLDLGPEEPTLFTLELLHLTDQEPLQAGGGFSNITNASGILNALRAQDLGDDGIADNTLTLSSGDAVIPGLFYSASETVFGAAGIADIQIQNELGMQAIAFGNHEFDNGPAQIAALLNGDAGAGFGQPNFTALTGTALAGQDFTGADFPYLSVNLDFASSPALSPLEVAGGQAPQAGTVTSSTVIDVNGEAIGIVGATTPTLASISSSGTLGISPTPFGSTPSQAELEALAAVIQAEVDALLDANPGLNKVILLSHMQSLEIEKALVPLLEHVDIIVGGGSNTRLFDETDRILPGDTDQGDYPQFITNAGGTQTAVVNTDGSYKYVGRLVVDFDENGHVIAESYDPDLSGAFATDAQGVADASALTGLNAAALIDPEIQAIVDAIEAEVISTEGNVFGVSSVFLNGNRSGEDTDGVRTQETNLGNLTADANLSYAKSIDAEVVISLKNGGGIRSSIGETVVPAGATEALRQPNTAVVDGDGNIVKPAGGISENDIKTALAFNNGLTVLTLTVQEIVDLLEHGVGGLPGVSGRFPQVSGVEFSFDPDLPAGGRILNAAVVDEAGENIANLVVNGVVQTPDAEFKIVTLDFLAGGGDGYPFPNTDDPAVAARVNPTPLEQEGVQDGDATFADTGSEQDALAEYLDDFFNPAKGGTAYAEADTTGALDERIQNLDVREDTVSVDADTFDFVFTGSNGGNDRFTDTAGRDLIITDGGRRDIFQLKNGGDDVVRIGDHIFDDARDRITITARQEFVLEIPELAVGDFEIYQRGSSVYVAFDTGNRFGDLVQIRGGVVTADNLQVQTYADLSELDIA